MNVTRTRASALAACLALASCASGDRPQASGHLEAIRFVLAKDSQLGSARNHAPESMPLAEAVRAYVAGLDEIDFSECPADFAAAFKRHRDAWQDSIEYFVGHDVMRGEMHDLFDSIREMGGDARGRIEDIEKGIWDTWAEVEAAVDRHGGG